MNSPLRMGIQGVTAAFHDVAARRYVSEKLPGREILPIECPSFKILGQKLRDKSADLCVMAIENSIAGSILTNYSLLESEGFKIIGEIYLRIEMTLMALPGETIASLTTVQSHPMALLQCEEFLSLYPEIKVLESSDTAESAKKIREQNLRGHAAIASALAAKTYGLEILKSGIETNKNNYTRFLIITRAADYRVSPLANKASIRFEVADRPGCLADVLGCFSRLGVNMTKIQSVPILGRPYEYSFHVDLEWEDPVSYHSAMQFVTSKVANLIHFGEYEKSQRPQGQPS